MKPAGSTAYAGGGVGSIAGLAANIVVQPHFVVALLLVVVVTGVGFLVGWMLEQKSDCGHHYWSTACVHLKHDECRLTCKFCATACVCGCHWKPAG